MSNKIKIEVTEMELFWMITSLGKKVSSIKAEDWSDKSADLRLVIEQGNDRSLSEIEPLVARLKEQQRALDA